ncbi:MAG: hypothetical protein Q4C58_07085 [Eubacteriales bacterium]|nr:hypothetical protein [Eubacteriales bacterium]
MRRRRKSMYQAAALATAFICAMYGPVCAGAAGTVYAAETETGEQFWKKDACAGEAVAQESIVKILTVADLESLAQQCTLDQWSVGKFVVLEADLDLTDSDFECIPTFGGTFDGNGHTISGFSMTGSGDVNGFFRYVQESGTVKNLSVSGEVAPEGHRDMTGGLVGNNKGMLNNCSFTGTVKGKNRAGGIAGINEAQGKIYNCSFEGDLTGEHYAGGIVGENLGSVVRCRNLGTVNITEVKVSSEISEFGLEMLGQTDMVSNVPASTDVGGIAGVSSGILQSCENAGDVGYPHTGYNVGGIAGRQSGYLDGCTNSGTINGRKDVGGIVGQFEPEVTLQFEPGMLGDLFTELEVLQGLIDTTIQDAKGISSSISGSIQGLADSTKNVKNATQGLSDSMIGWADENLEAINDFSARLSWAIDQMVPAADDMTDSLHSMSDAAGLLSDAIGEGKDMIGSAGDAMAGIKDALAEAGEAAEEMNAALKELGETIGNDEEVQKMIEALIASLIKQGDSFADLGGLIEDLAKSGEFDEAQAKRLSNLGQAYKNFGSAFRDLADVLKGVTVENGKMTGAEGLTAAADRVAQAGKELQIAGDAAAGGFAAEENGSGTEALDAYAQMQKETAELEIMLQEVSDLFEDLEAAGESGGTADTISEKLNTIQEKTQDITNILNEVEAAAKNEEEDGSLREAAEEARQQLALIEQTAETLAQRLCEASAGSEAMAGYEEEQENGSNGGDENAAALEDGAYFALESVTEGGQDPAEGRENGGQDNPEDPDNSEESGKPGDPDNSEEPGKPEDPDNPPTLDDVNWDVILENIQGAWKDAKEKLDPAMEKLLGSVDRIGESLEDLIEAGNKGTAALGTLSKASAKMKDSFRSMSSAANAIRSTLSGLAGKPAIQFTPLDSRITVQKDALDVALDDMTVKLDQLNNTMTVSSDVMLRDMEAINRQFGVIIRVLKQSNEKETEGIEDRIVDVSDEEEIGEQAEGCVSGSVNAGSICGDVNVAGIVGAMAIEYDFDPEDDLTKVGESSTDFSWLTSAVLSGCKNTGEITAKKDCVGGIVGRMDMGKVNDCENYGEVQSSGGNYVGGVAGASYAAIRDSWAKCVLSGTDFVGGIAGLGTTITNCHSLVEIAESSAFTGTIAGKLSEDGELADNTFVHKKLAGVDGISYAGQAEPVAYDELLSDSGTPEKFKEFELTFMADGELVSVVKFQYGKGISSLPEIPAKEGYSAKWPDLDYSCLTFSQIVEAEYTAYESALSAGGEIPELLVDGSFSSEAVIEDETQELTVTDTKGREHTGTAVTVRVKDPVLEEISYTVHYRLPEDKKNYRLWVKTPEGWEKCDYDTDGAYLLLKHEGEEVTFLLEAYQIPWGIAIALAAAAAAVLFIVAVLRIKKRKAAGKRKEK